jgi:hypothetical protein
MIFEDIKSEMTQNDFVKLQKNISKYKSGGKEKLKELQLKLN